MCKGDDPTCADFEIHHRQFQEDMARERRAFLASRAKGGVNSAGLTVAKPVASARQHYLPANADTVHWGFFSKNLEPQLEVSSGDIVTIETLTHQASDDRERMIAGDRGAESVYLWTKDRKGVFRRGAGPWRRAGAGRPYLYRSGLRARRPAGRRARGAHPRRHGAAERQSRVPRPCLRQQRSRQLGLSLQGLSRRRHARGGDHLRARCHGRAQLGACGLQLPLADGGRSVRQGASDDRLSRPACRSRDHDAQVGRAEGRARAGAAAFRGDGPRAPGSGRRQLGAAQLHRRQHRQLAHRQGRIGLLSGGGAGVRCCRSAIRMPARAIRSCAAPRSNARSPAPSSSCCTRRRISAARCSRVSTSR
jgi:hypothetical protein